MAQERELTHPLVGAVRYRLEEASPGARVELLDDWSERQLVEVAAPPLAGCEGRCVRLHRAAAGQWQAAWADLAAAGLLSWVLSLDGPCEPRLRSALDDSSEPLSPHALGLAFDLNKAANPRGADRCRPGLPGGVRVPLAKWDRHPA